MESDGATALATFVARAKDGGLTDADLVTLLRRSGWSERRIYAQLNAYYARKLGVDVPSRGATSEVAKDAFLYLLNFITLAFWTVALGNLFYVIIERRFSEPNVQTYESLASSISWQLATVIIAFPVFAYIKVLIDRELRARPDFAEAGVRLWLTYLALVIATVVILMDGIWFLSAFLTGELSMRFVLDSIVLLVLGGGVFVYYLTGLRSRAN